MLFFGGLFLLGLGLPGLGLNLHWHFGRGRFHLLAKRLFLGGVFDLGLVAHFLAVALPELAAFLLGQVGLDLVLDLVERDLPASSCRVTLMM